MIRRFKEDEDDDDYDDNDDDDDDAGAYAKFWLEVANLARDQR